MRESEASPKRTRGPVFVVRLQGGSRDDVHALRAILKALLRRYRLRCIGIAEERK